jgi:serine/threonine-protein kinase
VSERFPDSHETVVGHGDGPSNGSKRHALIGATLNGTYHIERLIAQGGMGDVYEALNTESGERLAVKVMRDHLADDPQIERMFRKEAQAMMRFSHPALVRYRVFARDADAGLRYLATDYIDGPSLAAQLIGERATVEQVLALARRLAGGLAVAHEHGIIHRDVSPDNILLPDGDLARATVINFGIAKSLSLPGETVVGDGFAGKLGYVAPEQFGEYDRSIGPWTDVYSLGLVLLAFVRGDKAGMGKTLSEAVRRRQAGPDLADVPARLAQLLHRMLEPDPARRFRSMEQLVAAVDAISSANLPPVARSHDSPVSSWRRAIVVTALVALLLLVVGTVLLTTAKPSLRAVPEVQNRKKMNPMVVVARPAPAPVVEGSCVVGSGSCDAALLLRTLAAQPAAGLTLTASPGRRVGAVCGANAPTSPDLIVGEADQGRNLSLYLVTNRAIQPIFIGREGLNALARAHPDRVSDAGTGRVRVSLCAPTPGRLHSLLLSGAGAPPKLPESWSALADNATELPPSEWSIGYDSQDQGRDDECLRRSIGRRRSLASCVR